MCPNTVVMGTEEMETKQVRFFSELERSEKLLSLFMLVLTSRQRSIICALFAGTEIRSEMHLIVFLSCI